jgi:nucleoside-diphosphate-sugar epimerase
LGTSFIKTFLKKNNIMKKRILITGGLGFIGTHCIEKWKQLDWDVYVIDNLSSNAITSDHPIAKSANIIISNILEVDWKNLPKFDLILHLASPVGPVGVLKHSGTIARIILDDIYWAIAGSKHNKCPLVFISTSEIYGYRECKSYLKENDDKAEEIAKNGIKFNKTFITKNKFALYWFYYMVNINKRYKY